MYFLHEYASPLGRLSMVSDGTFLTGLYPEIWRTRPNTLSRMQRRDSLPVFEQTCRWLDRYFSGENPGELPPLAAEGSPFRERVWRQLRSIFYGQLATCGRIVGAPECGAARSGFICVGSLKRPLLREGALFSVGLGFSE